MLFKYTATDDKGASREGTIEAMNIDIAITSLQRRGYMVTAVDPIAEHAKLFEKEFTLFEHISNNSATRQIIFTSS